MRNLKFYFFLILITIGCSKKNDKLEIFLLKERMPFSDGISIDNIETTSQEAYIQKQKWIKLNIKSDTINNQLIFVGKFKASAKDLQLQPLITDDEIISFNVKTSELEIHKSGFEKLIKLDRTNTENGIGIQFALCINGAPKIFGYLYNYSYFVTYLPSTYCISYKTNVEDKNQNSMILRFNDFIPNSDGQTNMRMLDSIREKEMFIALKNSKRLK